MAAPNELLRQAREQLPSREVAGEPASRREVADLVNEWLVLHHGTAAGVDANYIGKLERGLIRWPQKMVREALRVVLRVNSDSQIGLSARRGRFTPPATTTGAVEQGPPMEGLSALPWMDLFSPIQPTPIPGKISQVDIAQVRLACRTYMTWDNTYGGGLAREAVFAQLRWSAQLLDADCPARLRAELFSAVAEFGGVAGFMAFDAYAHDDARRTFRFSLRCAEESGDWHLRASILSMLARQAIWLGQADDGLTYVDMALVRSDRLTATERASLHTLRARALAKLGRAQECLDAVGAADEAFTAADPAEDPEWMAFYDHAQHHGDTAHALFDLSVHGVPTPAAERLAYSVIHHGPEYARSRTISRTKLASLLMATGDPREAARIGQAAVAGVHHLRSRRALTDVRELHGMAAMHAAIPEVADLRERIIETLGDV